MSFRMKVPSAKLFSDLVRAVSAIVEEGTFRIDDSSIKLCAMDPAHISLVDFEYLNSAAEEYECPSPLEFTLSMSEFLKFLRRAKGNEALDLSYDPERKRLKLTLMDPALSAERVFTVGVLDVAGERPPSPKLSFEAKARMDIDTFKDAVLDSLLVSDYVKVNISPDGVTLNARGELGTSRTSIGKSADRPDSALLELSVEKEASAYFSVNYLERILKAASPVSKELAIELSTNKPIKLSFAVPTGKLEYLVAPRIESGI